MINLKARTGRKWWLFIAAKIEAETSMNNGKKCPPPSP